MGTILITKMSIAAPGYPPSAFGFKNVRPIGREERKAANDKESIEKQRLRERREEYCQYEEPLARNLGGVSAANPGTVGWVPEAERFNSDSAGLLKVNQAAERQAQENFYDARRDSNVRREETRWESMEDQERRNAEIEAECAESRSRKNAGSAPFDMLTLQYHDTEAGEQLAAADQGARDRAVGRQHAMYDNANRSGFNPLTGGDNPYHSSANQ